MLSEFLPREAIYERLTGVFRDVFNDSTLTLRDDMTANDVAQWDSLNHINLVIEVERLFAVRFLTAEIARLKNVGEFADLIAKKLQR